MESLTTFITVIDKLTGEELLNEEDTSFALPEHDEIKELEGTIITIADKEYTIIEATTEPKLNNDCDMIGAYVYLRVENHS
ncbi:hypothetical protein [Dendrosporobacter sp. 1207_IL3150]|uniref:hypothetical protein n=1 Tax=Dendrosporobacter sp. 1207_IL3150 TaxID=3084054 RepID=UPI002FDA838B